MLSSVALLKLPSNIDNRYLFYVLSSPYFYSLMRNDMSGVAITRVTLAKLNKALIPIAPLNEQKRIVTKVDELMKLCDELEARQKKKQETRILINNAALNKLLTADTPETFTKNWQRIGDNFDILYSAPENIGKLRQAILQLAVMGKLVPQNANDEPAAVLLERIKKEKERLVKEGKIKKEKSLPAIKDDEIPYDLPIGWECCYISELAIKVTDGEHITPTRTPSGHYLLSARNIKEEGIILDNVDYVPESEFYRIRKRCNPDKDDILISCSGSVGRIAIVDKDDTYVMVRSVALLKLFKDNINSKYLAYILKSLMVQNQIIEKSKTSAQANLFLGKIKEIKVVLAPLNEQKRIVTKVDKLMKLCDELETKLTQTQTEREKIINAAVKQLLTV
jgi:type I restriction enzyme S subunit